MWSVRAMRIRSFIKYAEENFKPVVVICTDLPQLYKFDPKDINFGRLSKCPTFTFSTKEFQLNNENIENLKRMAYVIELLYKETMLADKIRIIELNKLKKDEEARLLADEAAKKRRKYVKL